MVSVYALSSALILDLEGMKDILLSVDPPRPTMDWEAVNADLGFTVSHIMNGCTIDKREGYMHIRSCI